MTGALLSNSASESSILPSALGAPVGKAQSINDFVFAAIVLPDSPVPGPKGPIRDVQQREKEYQQAMLAAQTVFKKLSSAFWDAFTGSSSSSRRRRPPHRRHHMLRITTTRVIINWDRCSACWKAK